MIADIAFQWHSQERSHGLTKDRKSKTPRYFTVVETGAIRRARGAGMRDLLNVPNVSIKFDYLVGNDSNSRVLARWNTNTVHNTRVGAQIVRVFWWCSLRCRVFHSGMLA